MRASPACVDSLPTPRCSLERGMASHPAGGGLWYKVLYTFRYKNFWYKVLEWHFVGWLKHVRAVA